MKAVPERERADRAKATDNLDPSRHNHTRYSCAQWGGAVGIVGAVPVVEELR